MKIIGKLWCWIVRKFGGRHDWRRAHKNEALGTKYCRRCGAPRAVKRRIVTEQLAPAMERLANENATRFEEAA